MCAIVGREGLDPPAASTSQMGRVETEGPGQTHEISRLKATAKRGARAYRNRRGGGKIANLQCIDLGCSCTASSLTTPCTLIALISCVGPEPKPRDTVGEVGRAEVGGILRQVQSAGGPPCSSPARSSPCRKG